MGKDKAFRPGYPLALKGRYRIGMGGSSGKPTPVRYPLGGAEHTGAGRTLTCSPRGTCVRVVGRASRLPLVATSRLFDAAQDGSRVDAAQHHALAA